MDNARLRRASRFGCDSFHGTGSLKLTGLLPGLLRSKGLFIDSKGEARAKFGTKSAPPAAAGQPASDQYTARKDAIAKIADAVVNKTVEGW